MHRKFLILLAAAGLAGCATTNDSGVVLHTKPDLSTVVPGTPVDKVAALKKPLKKEPIVEGTDHGAELWIYEWDLPDDGVNNRMFTSVVVKNGLIVSFREETAEKWKQDSQLHMTAKLDSALEDVSSLKATAARYQRVASMRDTANAAPYADTLDLLTERARFIHGNNPMTVGQTAPDAAPAESQVAAVGTPAAPEVSAVASAPAPSPAPAAPVVEVALPRKTLRQLEAEELRIRADASLTKKERMRRLHDIWKQQREVTSGGALAES